MSLNAFRDPAAVPSVIVVDPRFDAYGPLAAAAREGRINLHLRGSGAEAMRLALQLSHPVYDCLYLALAKRLGTYVVSADTRFGRAVADHGTHIGHIRVLSPVIRGPGPRL